MNRMFIFVGLLLPSFAFALDYDTSVLPYTDIPSDHVTQVSISTLTELGIVQGNPDGTFLPSTPINRAEFMKIAMGLLPPVALQGSLRCFPDVDPNIWFAAPVCRAKDLGIVRGNAIAGIDSNLWEFEPVRSVKYEEALKILSNIYNLPLIQDDDEEWYQKYLRTAKSIGLELDDSAPGSALTRGQMARLVVAYLAYSKGELEDLRYAETHPDMPVRVVFDPPASSSSSSSISSASSASSETSSVIYDPLMDDVTSNDSVLILGQVTHVLGSAEFFPNAEGIIAHKFIVDLVAANTSISALNIYDHDGIFIGRATIDPSVAGNIRYTLNVKNKDIVLERREPYSIYVRGVLKSQDEGGTSGGSLQIDQIGVDGVGYWSSNDYEVFTSASDVFAASTVAQSGVTGISNAGAANESLFSTNNTEIGAFYFEGVTGHSTAKVQLLSIIFQIEQLGGVTVSDVGMKVDGSSERITCTVSSDEITCSSLPDSFGRLDDGPRTLRIFADVMVPDDSQKAALRLSINDPGTISSAGSITWSDGVTTFTWIDMNQTPLARGTYYSR
jgi:hypothetical protein